MPDPAPSLAQLLAALKRDAGSSDKALPPVDQWNPAQCGDIGMEILADGTWRHEGTPIARESLVRLFASILRKDADGATWLVTPAEKVAVDVADAPFLAVRADRAGAGPDQTILFTTNVGDVLPLDPAYPLRVTHSASGEPRPYVLVRGRLEARILRAPWRELAEWGEEREGSWGVWSGGAWWELG
ncbi:MAG: DUF1285 domain-containing protein [Vitreimonas sp.]